MGRSLAGDGTGGVRIDIYTFWFNLPRKRVSFGKGPWQIIFKSPVSQHETKTLVYFAISASFARKASMAKRSPAFSIEVSSSARSTVTGRWERPCWARRSMSLHNWGTSVLILHSRSAYRYAFLLVIELMSFRWSWPIECCFACHK